MFGLTFWQHIIAFIGFALLWYTARKHKLLHVGILVASFAYAQVALDLEQVSLFYIPLILFYGLVLLGSSMIAKRKSDSLSFQNQAESFDANGNQPGGLLTGWTLELWSFFLMIVVFFLSRVLSVAAKVQIIGTPELAVTGGASFLSDLQLITAPFFSGAIGYIENGFFFALFILLIEGKEIFTFVFDFIAANPITGSISGPMLAPLIIALGYVFPIITICALFGLFHIVAYFFSISTMIWAGSVMLIMIGSYFASGKDMTAANGFHFWHNETITVGQSLSIQPGF